MSHRILAQVRRKAFQMTDKELTSRVNRIGIFVAWIRNEINRYRDPVDCYDQVAAMEKIGKIYQEELNRRCAVEAA